MWRGRRGGGRGWRGRRGEGGGEVEGGDEMYHCLQAKPVIQAGKSSSSESSSESDREVQPSVAKVTEEIRLCASVLKMNHIASQCTMQY